MQRFAKLLLILAVPACASAQDTDGARSAPTPTDVAPHGMVVDRAHAPERMGAMMRRGPRIAVGATGSASRAPEQAVVQLAVETTARTAREAAAQNAQRMTQLIAALRRLDIPEDRIQTTAYNMYPEYAPHVERAEPREPEIIGYRVMNMVSVTVDGPERAGAVIDAALAAGANRISGLGFQLSDPDAVRAEALRDAMATARAEAALLAEAAGLTLGEPIEISTSFSGGPPPPMPYMAMERGMAQQDATSVQPGTVEVRAVVNVVYSAHR